MKINSPRKIGYMEELLADGTVSHSWVRLSSAFFFILLCAFTVVSLISYESHFDTYVKLLQDKSITEQSFNMLTSQLKRIEWEAFSLLVTATVLPKAIQKFAEAKTGIKNDEETPT